MGVRERSLHALAAFFALWCAAPPLAATERGPAGSSAPDPGFRRSASVSFFSFFGPGVTIEYEEYFRPPALSFVSGLGFRTTGGADYLTLTFTTSLEGRLWLANVVPWRGPDRTRMVGPFLSLREDIAWTTVEDRTRGRQAGTAVEAAETLGLGYRLTLWRLHATPILGGTVTTQLDPRGRLAPLTFLSGKLAITLGVMF